MIYNVKYSTDTLLLVAGDRVNFTISVEECNATCQGMDLSGLELEWVITFRGKEVVKWSTIEGTLIISGNEINVNAPAIERKGCCHTYKSHLYIVAPRTTLLMGLAKII